MKMQVKNLHTAANAFSRTIFCDFRGGFEHKVSKVTKVFFSLGVENLIESI